MTNSTDPNTSPPNTSPETEARDKNPPLPEIAYLHPSEIICLGPERLDDRADHELYSSLSAQSQMEPILCARHDGQLYLLSGARRLQAAKGTGRDVLAVIYDDFTEDSTKWVNITLDAHQARLSYIERALWVRREMEAGRAREDIANIAALHPSEISRMLAIVNALPESLIRAIGRAPKIGRRRWLHLVELIKRTSHTPKIDENMTADSNTRFEAALAQLEALTAVKTRRRARPECTTLMGRDREPLGQKITRPRSIALQFGRRFYEDFVLWLETEMPKLHNQFKTNRYNQTQAP